MECLTTTGGADPMRSRPAVAPGLDSATGPDARLSSKRLGGAGAPAARSAEVRVRGRAWPPGPAACAWSRPCLQEERLVDLLDGLGLLGHRDRQRAEPDRLAGEGLAQRGEDRPVDLVEAQLVDLEQRERGAGGRRRSTVPSPRTSA